jgi:hypothetical protein
MLSRRTIALTCAAGAGCAAHDDASETTGTARVSSLPGPSAPLLPIVGSGGMLQPGEPALMTVETHCGVRYLGQLNGSDWVASDPVSAQPDWIPAEWSSGSSPLKVRVELDADRNTIEASLDGQTIEYVIVEHLAEEMKLCA